MKKILIIFQILAVVIFLNSCATKKPSQEEAKKTAQYYFKVGVSYLNSGNTAEAIYNLNKAYTLDNKNPEILNALGIAYSKVGELDKAQQYFLEAIKVAPQKGESYLNLGVLLAEKKDYGSALKYLKKVAENPNYKSQEKVYYNMALVDKAIGNIKEYEENLKKAIAYNNSFLPAYLELGNYYIATENYEKAQSLYEKAISIGLGTPEIYYSLAYLYYKKEKYELAKKYLKTALILTQSNPVQEKRIKELLSKVEEKLNQQTKIKKTALKKEEKPTKQKEYPKIIIYPNVKKGSEYSYIPREPIIREKKKEENKTPPSNLYTKKTEPKKEKSFSIKFFINLGTFSLEKNAKKLHAKLKLYGYDSKIEKIKVDGKIYYIVYIGYFDSYLKASRFYKKNLKPAGFIGIIKFKRIEDEKS
ncbi:SPOR domain-containing protein [Hydrogenothermus marinus]|uniref:Type IV pilus biogenesis/stability protein PilW n=1 Tax=Hydrogenothermus marinus TaxID=133270 RepID=A0A3M0B529_9AQUI|nr:tetratricopeptide repeat protein [Hydrogenothermus marinus]RMA92500.1 type IV pilus biogenesis/stability protein PilW [Hydrogenothermus marinus]